MNIQFSPPDVTGLEIEAVSEALRSGWITTGPQTKLFEQRIAEYCNTPKVVCLSSGSAALELTLRILGVGPGDEVITSAYTYTASASVICHTGATLVLVDTAPGSFEMDYTGLADAVTEKTKVIIPVDIGGVMCDYDRIFEIAESKKHLFRPENDLQKAFGRCIILADGAHSFGAAYRGKRSGNVADFTAFSFHAVKNLTTAEGGAVTWPARAGVDGDDLYRRFVLMSLHGQSKDALAKMKLGAWEYDVLFPGYKYNMTDLTAAFGLAQLERFDGLAARRRQIMRIYDDILLPCGIRRLEHNRPDSQGNGHLYLVRIPGTNEAERNKIIMRMAEAGVVCNVHFKPLPMMTAYRDLGFDIGDFPNAYAQYRNEITLPGHTLLTDAEARYVAETLKAILNENRRRDDLLK